MSKIRRGTDLIPAPLILSQDMDHQAFISCIFGRERSRGRVESPTVITLFAHELAGEDQSLLRD